MRDAGSAAPLKQRDEGHARLRADVEAGLAQLARGQGQVFTPASTKALAEDVKARGRKRLFDVHIAHI